MYRRFLKNGNAIQAAELANYPASDTAHGSYGALLLTPEWRAKRAEILNRDLHACVVCKMAKNLQVHHRQYHFVKEHNRFKLPWDYPENLLITLCADCHSQGHNKFKVSTITI